MDKYVIKYAYGVPEYEDEFKELEISSDNLFYSEMGLNHSGCQVNHQDNQKEIHKKCVQIANLIREIDKLNK